MNRKQLIILLVLVAVIGTAGLVIRQHNRESWQSAETSIGQKLLPRLAINDIAQIVIRSGTNELNLAKRDNLWRVSERNDYLANFSQISGLLIKFADLKIAQTEDVGSSQLGRLELLPPGASTNSGTLVEFKDQNGKTLDSVLLGKKHLRQSAGPSQPNESWPDGRYVMPGGDTKTVAVISDPLDDVQTQPAHWLDKDFFSIQKPRSIALRFPEATNSWKLTRASETNDWRLADTKAGEKLDSSKISSVTAPFSSEANFDDVAPLSDQTDDLTNATELTVDTFDGFTYVIKIGAKQNDEYPVSLTVSAHLPAARVADKNEKPDEKTKLDKAFKEQQAKLTAKLAKEKQLEKWVYDLPAYSVDEILKPRDQLLVEPKTDKSAKPGK